MTAFDNRYNFYKFFLNSKNIILAHDDYKFLFDSKSKKQVIFFNKNLNKIIDKYKKDTEIQNIAIISNKNFLINDITNNYLIIPSLYNPKWIIPFHNRRIINPSTFVKPSKLVSHIIWKAALFLNNFKLISLFFSNKLTIISKNKIKNHYDEKFNEIYSNYNKFALYTGAYGPYQKFTFQILNNKNEIIGYSKTGTNQRTNLRIENEIEFLSQLNCFDFKSLSVPKLKGKFEVNNFSLICQSNEFKNAKPSQTNYTSIHNTVLIELFNTTKKTIDAQDYINQIKSCYDNQSQVEFVNNQNQIFKNAFKYLELKLLNKNIFTGISHGDFNSWNILSLKDNLYIFDWELADYRTPLWDFFHFMIFYYLRFSSKTNLEIENLLISDNNLKNYIEKYL